MIIKHYTGMVRCALVLCRRVSTCKRSKQATGGGGRGRENGVLTPYVAGGYPCLEVVRDRFYSAAKKRK